MIHLHRANHFLAFTVLLFAATLLVGAQETSTASAAPASSPAVPTQTKPPSISFDFRGGSLSDLVTQVGKSDGRSFNLLSEPSLPGVTLPAFTLRNADPAAFAKALNLLLGKYNLRVELMASESTAAEPVAVIALGKNHPNPPPGSVGSANPVFDSFQLKPYLLGQSVNDIVAAIRSAWEIDPGHDPKAVRLKYNQATKLLLFSGPPEAIVIARKVISHLSTRSKFMQFQSLDSDEDATEAK